jgi:hypothetical protein
MVAWWQNAPEQTLPTSGTSINVELQLSTMLCCSQTRMFGTRPVEPLPSWVSPLADRISQLPSVAQPLDQLTVNEYTPGVGLAPHIDTHSAFTGESATSSKCSRMPT